MFANSITLGCHLCSDEIPVGGICLCSDCGKAHCHACLPEVPQETRCPACLDRATRWLTNQGMDLDQDDIPLVRLGMPFLLSPPLLLATTKSLLTRFQRMKMIQASMVMKTKIT